MQGAKAFLSAGTTRFFAPSKKWGGTIIKIILYFYRNQTYKAPHPSRRSRDTFPQGGRLKATATFITAPLRCPKSAGTAFAVADFDLGGIKSSLHRPQDALGFYTPKGEGLRGFPL